MFVPLMSRNLTQSARERKRKANGLADSRCPANTGYATGSKSYIKSFCMSEHDKAVSGIELQALSLKLKLRLSTG